MGNIFYKKELVLEDAQVNRMPLSKEHNTTEWEYTNPKNFDYYFNKDRFTYISRGNYKNDFENGYIWGRNAKKKPLINIYEQIDKIEETENEEIFRDF